MQTFAAGATNNAWPSNALTFYSPVAGVTAIKQSRGQLFFLHLMNGAAATSFLQIFFLSTSTAAPPSQAIVLGTTVPDFVIALPTNAGSGFVVDMAFPVPIGAFLRGGAPGSGISVAGTTTANGATPATIHVSAVYL